MSLESALQYIIQHNTLIIEVLFAVILVTVLILAYRSFTAPLEGPSGAGSFGDIEEALKKVLEQAKASTSGAVAADAAAGKAISAETAQLATEITQLKTELEKKQQEIETLKAQTPAPAEPSGLDSEEKQKLESQIQELTNKLAEYEIISEDIADLSLYKEQNARLQKELDALKSGGGAQPTEIASSPQPEPALETIAETMAEPTNETSLEAAAAAFSAAVQETPVTPEAVSDLPPVTEVSETVSAEPVAATAPPVAAETKPVATPTPAATPGPSPETKTAEKPAEDEVPNTIDEDLMRGFAAAVEKQKTDGAPAEPEGTVDLGTMDMEKMMAEATTIPEDVPEVSVEEALGTGLDENKLLAEASALGSQEKELMGEFENFVKKEKA